jgi:hypothetical protein
VELDIHLTYPQNQLDWHIEADALVGGQRKTLAIGESFHSPGSRDVNQYAHGHSTDGDDWGLDSFAIKDQMLRWRSFEFPYASGMDVYALKGVSEERTIRVNEQPLIIFAIPDQKNEAYPFMSTHLSCGPPGLGGQVRTTGKLQTRRVSHGTEQLTDETMPYQCNIPGPRHQRNNADYDSKEWWNCGDSLCPEQTLRVRYLHSADSKVALWFDEDGLSESQVALANSILDGFTRF